jgi:hypothetical protein
VKGASLHDRIVVLELVAHAVQLDQPSAEISGDPAGVAQLREFGRSDDLFAGLPQARRLEPRDGELEHGVHQDLKTALDRENLCPLGGISGSRGADEALGRKAVTELLFRVLQRFDMESQPSQPIGDLTG